MSVNRKTTTINRSLQTETINLEAFACLWLDADIGQTEDTKKTEAELRKLINYLRIYQTIEACQQAIRRIGREKIILISSGQLGINLIPRVHDLPQLIACYIFCFTESTYSEWASRYSKVNRRQIYFRSNDFFVCKF